MVVPAHVAAFFIVQSYSPGDAHMCFYYGSLGPPQSATKRTLDRLRCFCMAHGRDQYAQTQTQRAHYDKTCVVNSTHLCCACDAATACL